MRGWRYLFGVAVCLLLSVSAAFADTQTSYSYDALGRLTSVTTPTSSTTYTYDPAGNRTQVTQTAAADTTPPTLSSTTPANNATGIAVGSNLVLTFNEAVKAGTGNIVIYNFMYQSVVATIPVTDTTQVSFSGSTVTINPTSDLPANTYLYVTIASGAIQDIAGNNYAGISDRSTFDFTTGASQGGDTTPPTLSSTTPANAATGVAVGSNLVLTFNEAVKAGSGYITIKKSSDNSVVTQILVTDTSQVSFSGSMVTINPTSDLATSTGYYVTMASGVIQDLAGNAYAGISSATTFYFTTAAAGGSDTTPPTLSSTTPANAATGVAVGSNLVLTFNEAVKAGSGYITIKKSSDNSVVTQILVTDTTQVSFSGSTVTINPTSDLGTGTQYYVLVPWGAIQDIAGNNYAGISSTTAFNFTTAGATDTTPPTLLSTTPANNATGVAVSSNLFLTFNEAVKAGSSYIYIYDWVTDSVVQSIPVNDTNQVFFSGSTVTINPLFDLDVNTRYYVLIDSGAIKDVSGNSYAGISSYWTFNFTTASGQQQQPPIGTFTAGASTITAGSSTTLNWTSSNATSASINNGVGGVTPVSGGAVTVSPTSTTTYTVTLTGTGGTTTYSTTITVVQPPTGTFTAGASTITAGSSTTLNWISSNATSVSINNGVGSVTPVSSGSVTVTPTATTTYTLTLTNAAGTTQTYPATVTVTTGNRPPVAVNDTVALIQQAPPYGAWIATNFNPLANDYDPDGDPLTITGATVTTGCFVGVNNGATLSIGTNTSTRQTCVATYTISDGHGNTATATVTAN